ESAHEIEQAGGQAIAEPVDVADYDSCQSLVDSTVKKYGKVDGLVNNAGIDIIKPADECTRQDWEDIININLGGYFNCAHIVGKHMLERGQGGAIVNN